MIYLDVDTAITVPVNVAALIDDTDFKSREESIAYNAAGMDLVWNFITSAGVITQTIVTPTTGGVYDWTHIGDAMYKIEIPASGGGTINNDTEGFGWFSGFVTGVLPFRGPTIGFRAAGLNNLLTDNAFSATRGLAGTALPAFAANAIAGLPTAPAAGLFGGLTNFIDVLSAMACSHGDGSTAQAELQGAGAGGGSYDGATDSSQAVRDKIGTITDLGGGATLGDNLSDMAGATFTAGGDDLENITSDVGTLLARLTGTRAAKLDNVPAGLMPTQAEVLSIQNNTRTTASVPQVAERPDAGSTLLKIYLNNYDTAGNMEAPDSAPTVAVVNETGTTRSGNLQHPTTHSASTTMVNLSTGRYWIEYDLDTADALESLTFTFTVIEGGATRTFDRQMLVVDTTAVDFTAADRAKLDTLHDSRLTAARASNLDNLDAAISSLNDLDAAGIRTAVGMSGADLDTQLAALPTVSEFNARTLLSGSYFVAATDVVANVTLVGSVTTKTGYELAAAEDVYHADIDLRIDEANTLDEWMATWFKNGVAVTSGISTPTLQVVKRADGTDLIASTAMTEIGSTGSYKLDEATNRTTAGEAALAIVGATIDGSPRSWRAVIGRDSTA